MLNRINPTINKKGLFRDLNTLGPFIPGQKGFSLAFGVGQDLDPRIGYYSLSEVQVNYANMPNEKGGYDRDKKKRDLSLVKCETDNFKYDNMSEVMMYGINKLMCIKDPDFSL